MTIPTEPIGSIPRPIPLIEAVAAGEIADPCSDPLYEAAVRDTIERFEATGSPVITDGEQRKYDNFWTYSVHGLPNTAPDGFKIPFAAGHTRRMPRLTRGPFRYKRYADSYVDVALRYANAKLKQAVISPSALSLMYPPEEIPGYSRDEFINDLLSEHETEIRLCLKKGAFKVIGASRLRLEVQPCEAALFLHGDGERVEQIVLNLLSNAVKFTAAGGVVRITACSREDLIDLQVQDTGVGIPSDKLEGIFAPFFQVDQSHGRASSGTGLGLAISRELARAMDGDLTVESVLGKGSTFTLSLPRATAGALQGL